MQQLLELYCAHTGKVSDKWSSNIRFYDEAFGPVRNRELRILEIGIQNGGSLEIWAKYFPSATHLVGCDINEKCRDLVFDDPRISVVVGDANDPAIQAHIRAVCDGFDIIIDDGSHRSSDIVRTFAAYFPLLSEGGLYIAEDLHCSYWQEFEGGIEDTGSSIAFFRRLTDFVNREHWGADIPPDEVLSYFTARWGARFPAPDLERIAQVVFRNSLVAVSKQRPDEVVLGPRLVSGRNAYVSMEMLGLSGTTIIAPGQCGNRSGPLSQRSEQAAASANGLQQQVSEAVLRAAAATERAEVAEAKNLDTLERLRAARRQPVRFLSSIIAFRVLKALSHLHPPLPKAATDYFSNVATRLEPLDSDTGNRQSIED